MRGTLLTPLLAAGLLVLTGCEDWGDWGPSDRYKEDFHHSYAMKPGGTLSMENFNGPVEIMSWEQDTVEINGTKHASQRSYLDEMKIDVSATPGAVRIRTLRPSLSHCNCGARYSIRVPRRVMLDEIVSSNGGIRIDRIEGNARVRTSNGSIDAEATHGSFEAETSNGRIEVTLVEPGADWPMRLTTSNGHIELTMKGNKLPDVRASTSNSSVVVHLPASVNARVRAATSHHNNITTDFNELLRSDEEDDRRRRRSEVEGRLGSGGPLIDLSTSNGPIKILKLENEESRCQAP